MIAHVLVATNHLGWRNNSRKFGGYSTMTLEKILVR